MPQWGMSKKPDLAKNEGRLIIVILITGLILAAFLGTVGANKLVTNPQLCVKCHVMVPEYETWKASSHVQYDCTVCHTRTGPGAFILSKTSAAKWLYLYFTGSYRPPIKMDYKINDDVCTSCHSGNRDFTPSGDLIIPHDKHAAKKVLCVECHSGVAHGNIAARNVTADGNYQVWTDDVGKKQMAKDYSEPKMNTCLECHIKRGVTQACEACHTQISKPADHKVKDFAVTHGHLAKGNVSYCNKCHSYSVEAKDVPASDPLTRYARGNVFCYDCHQKRPTGHTSDWRMIHKKDVVNSDVSGCLVCHNNDKTTPKDKAVPTYCAKCHGKQAVNQTVPSKIPNPGDKTGQPGNGNPPPSGGVTFTKIHPPNWRTLHPKVVKEKGASNEGCWNCHDTTHCSRCHTNKL